MPSADTCEHIARGLIARTLPREQWTHEAHLRAGLWHGLHHDADTALQLLRERIRAYNVAVGTANTDTGGYHETITRCYVALIAAFLAGVDTTRPTEQLATQLLARYGARDLLYTYYTRERLHSVAARRGWLAPDVEDGGHADATAV